LIAEVEGRLAEHLAPGLNPAHHERPQGAAARRARRKESIFHPWTQALHPGAGAQRWPAGFGECWCYLFGQVVRPPPPGWLASRTVLFLRTILTSWS